MRAYQVGGHSVEFIVKAIFAGPVAAIVGKPELTGLGMKVEADAVADPARDDLHAGTVRVVAPDLPVHAQVDLAHVARRAHGNVDLVVRAQGKEFPVVMHLGRQLECVGHVDRCGHVPCARASSMLS